MQPKQPRPLPVVLYDTGALIAAEAKDDRIRLLHRRFLTSQRLPAVPSPVLAQAWRGEPGQARLSWLLRGCLIRPTSEAEAKAAGVLLRRSSTGDAIDAIVVAIALEHDATVVTSDPDDLRRLADAAPGRRRLRMIPV